MSFFSLIIPIYKCEPFLRKCLDSVQSQTFKDWEAILIDDGSPDNSGKICDEYAEKDPRFKVIHKKNSGVSDTRNKGLDVAKGEYIVFVDSDDWIGHNYLSSFAVHQEYDLILTGYHRFGAVNILGYGTEEDAYKAMSEFVQAWKTLFDAERRSISGLTFICGKAFRANLIKSSHLRFDSEMKFGEDACFVYNYIMLANNAIVIRGNEYHYYTPFKPNQHTLTLEQYQYHCKYFCETIRRIASKFEIDLSLPTEANCVGAFMQYYSSFDNMNLSQFFLMSSQFLQYNAFDIFPMIERVNGKRCASIIKYFLKHPFLFFLYNRMCNNVRIVIRNIRVFKQSFFDHE